VGRGYGGVVVMPSKPAIVKQRDVTRIMRGAEAAGVKFGIVIKEGEVRFLPASMIADEPEISAFDTWRKQEDARKARGRSQG
jgi:hypothetical protein